MGGQTYKVSIKIGSENHLRAAGDVFVGLYMSLRIKKMYCHILLSNHLFYA